MVDYSYGIALTGTDGISPIAKKAEIALARLRAETRRQVTAAGGVIKANRLYAKELTETNKKTIIGNNKTKQYSQTQKQLENRLTESLDATSKISKEVTTYGKIEDTHNKKIKKQIKRHKELNKTIAQSGKIQKTYSKNLEASGKVYTNHQSRIKKLNQAKAKTIPISKKQIATTKQIGVAEKHVQKMLKLSADEYKTYNKNLQATGKYSKIATNIHEKGLESVTAATRKNLKIEAKRIEAIRKAGVVAPTAIRKQQDALLALNQTLNKNMTMWGKFKGGVSKAMGAVKMVGLTFLSLIGPLFLVDAAIRLVGNAVRWATDPFIEFEDAMFELRKTAGLSMEAMRKIGNEIESLTAIVPLTAKELGNIAATAGRLGIRGTQDILMFTKTVAKMSIATDLTAEDAAQALGKLTAAFSIPIKDVMYLGSVINELSNITASSASDIVEAMKRVGAAGKMLGFAVEEVAVMTSTLIDMGMAAQRSGTRLRRLFTEMARKSHEMAEQMNKDAKLWKKTIEEDPMSALITYLSYLKELPSSLDQATKAHDVFGKVGGFAALSLAQNLEIMTKNLEIAQHEMLYATSLTEEYSIAISKTSAELQILTNRAEMARREFGEKTIPVLKLTKKAWADFLMTLSGTTYAELRFKEGAIETTGAMVALRSQMEPVNDVLNSFHFLMEKSNRDLTILEKYTGGITFEELIEGGNKVSRTYNIMGHEFFNLEDYMGAFLTRQDAVNEGNEYLIASTGKVVSIFKEEGKWTEDLDKKEKKLKKTKDDLGMASDYENYIENELNELRKDEIKNADEIISKENELGIVRITAIKADERYILAERDLTKAVYEKGKSVAWSTDIIKDDSKAMENQAEIYEYVVNTLYPKGSLEISKLFAVLNDGTDLTKEWSSIVGETTAEAIDGFSTTEKKIAYMDSTLETAGFTIKWIGGLAKILPIETTAVRTVEYMEDAMFGLDKIIGNLMQGLGGLVQLEQTHEAILNELVSSTERLVDNSSDYISKIYERVDLETHLSELENEAPKRAKREIKSLRKQYSEIEELIKQDKIKEAMDKRDLIATELSTEAIDLLGKRQTTRNDELMESNGIAIDYAQTMDRLLFTDIDIANAIEKDNALEITHGKLMEKNTEQAEDYSDAIKRLEENLGLEEGAIKDVSEEIKKAIIAPDIAVQDFSLLVDLINDQLNLIGLPKIDEKEFKESLEAIKEDTEGLPAPSLQIDIDQEFFTDAFKRLKEEIEPLELKVKLVPETPIFGGIAGGIGAPEAQTGGKVLKTGLIKVHRGEDIISAHEVRKYNKHDINVRINFAGNVPSEISRNDLKNEVKKIIGNEIKKVL